ncbi:MAG: hypothetical protein HY520_01405 [Candidatus Aenigmarchaeota archaeon]|nr:hypothetical protein [Candidatus Aenigmarchaeota archaeon]
MAKDYRTEAEKTVDALIRSKEKRLLVCARSQRIFLCGDYDTETLSILQEARESLFLERYNPFLLDGTPATQIDHLNKELVALRKADIVILVDGERPGTWTESILAMLQDQFGKKVLFFYDRNKKTIETVGNCQDYHVYFLSKYGYSDRRDLIKQIITFAKQAAHHEACRLLREESE